MIVVYICGDIKPDLPEFSGMKSISCLFASFLFLIMFMQGCAKVGTPVGGPKDITPPRYVNGEPENRSTGFNQKEITFQFDEFIQLKDLNKELLVSPPLKVKPDIRLKDKSIKINLKNELAPNTTYTINFGNSISDLNEGNLLPDFEYVFSTGDKIDSLSVAGRVVNAFDHKPLKDQVIMVMLYNNLADSTPLRQIPRYIGRANKDGLFAINNIHPDTCRLIAINDANNNLKYDPGAESFAFLDSFIVVNENTVKPITFIKDTIKIKAEKTKEERSAKKASVKAVIDSTAVQGRKLNAVDVSLFYFMEETDYVALTEKKREQGEKLFFVFNRPPHDSVTIRPVNFSAGSSWFIKEISNKGDSITCWITDSTIAKTDTLKVSVSYTSTDSLNRFVNRTDTIKMKIQKTEEKAITGKKAKTAAVRNVVHKMVVTPSLSGKGKQDLNKPVVFTLEKPLLSLNNDSIEFYSIRDSVSTKQPFTCAADPASLRRFRITTPWEENMHYRLLLKPGTVKDIYRLTNDSVEIKFSTQQLEYYGRILVTVQGTQFPVILQVLDEKGKLSETKIVKEEGKITFDYLSPQKYTLKAIIDRNGNGSWDTGNYLKHIQPEKTFFYTLPIQLRSNWDQEVTWIIPDL
jgi:hypothetical protein